MQTPFRAVSASSRPTVVLPTPGGPLTSTTVGCGRSAGGMPPRYRLSARYANIRSMRWDNLQVEQQQGRHLPGYAEPAVVRHFDAPEALDIRFYEVQAKSALNRVPERSRMPFRW